MSRTAPISLLNFQKWSAARTLRRFFLIFPFLYLAALILLAAEHSGARRSVLDGGTDAGSTESASEQSSPASSHVQLQSFHRMQIKDGKPAWEIQAGDAKYFPDEKVTHVNNAHLVLYREKGDQVVVDAAAAKLYLAGEGVLRAVLEGKTEITSGEKLALHTNGATFDSTRGEFFTESVVEVSGEGFHIDGRRLRYVLATGTVVFDGDVKSKFEAGAQLPSVTRSGLH